MVAPQPLGHAGSLSQITHVTYFSTMMANVDYARLYFKYLVPTPIIGEPAQYTLKQLKHDLRANASSVDTDLGGGDHGYLGLYLSDVE